MDADESSSIRSFCVFCWHMRQAAPVENEYPSVMYQAADPGTLNDEKICYR